MVIALSADSKTILAWGFIASKNSSRKWKGKRIMAFDRITRDSNQMNGQPCIRGMRLTVRRVLEAIASYPDRKELFDEYPELEEEDLRQALEFAAASMDDRLGELKCA